MRFILIEASAEFVHISTENILIYMSRKKNWWKFLKIVLAWVSGLPSFPFPQETPDTQAKLVLIFRHLTFVWELTRPNTTLQKEDLEGPYATKVKRKI